MPREAPDVRSDGAGNIHAAAVRIENHLKQGDYLDKVKFNSVGPHETGPH
jgi:hypothetical protein